MIAEIGLIVAAHVVFRGIEGVVHLAPGDQHEKLPVGAQVFLALLAVGVVILGVAVGRELLQRGTERLDMPGLPEVRRP